jgi:hypothetical protein
VTYRLNVNYTLSGQQQTYRCDSDDNIKEVNNNELQETP